ncbi:TPA: hypothetical protein DCW61_02185 [Candidatus Uhrbacteria bacterium]|nr:hypothetical protein [Candidatus Uhrbacteria bacterium]
MEIAHQRALEERRLEASKKPVETIKKIVKAPTFEPKFEKLLENIERLVVEQRKKIAQLQSVYDKAWFGRGKKLQELETAKTKRTELLKKRNEVRKEAGIIDIEDDLMTETTTENKLEKLLENIKAELGKKRTEILRLKSKYDKAWFGRETKHKQFEEAKKDFILYARKLKETHKDIKNIKNKELNEYLDAFEKNLFDEWKE